MFIKPLNYNTHITVLIRGQSEMILKNIKDKQKGFTIVELLVVIVVIGILAAITVVSYTGISQKANTTKALSNAQSVQNVAEIYFAQNQGYPTTITQFSDATLSAKLPTNITLQAAAVTSASTPSQIQYEYCSAGATGARISYWSYSTPIQITQIFAGSATNATCTTWTGIGA